MGEIIFLHLHVVCRLTNRKMELLCATLLADKAPQVDVTKETLKSILTAAGASADDAKIDIVLSALKDKPLNELISSGKEKMASMVTVAAAAPAAGGAAAGNAAAAEAKKEEPEAAPEASESVSEIDINF